MDNRPLVWRGRKHPHSIFQRVSCAFTLLVMLASAGCIGTNDDPDPTVYAFRRGETTVSFIQIGVDSAIILTRAVPVMQGKGRLSVSVTGRPIHDTVFVFRPVGDTLVSHPQETGPGGHTTISLPWEFSPDGVVEERWLVRLKPYQPGDYVLSTRATMDSIFIPDSNRYYGYRSDEVSRYLDLGPNRGFTNFGVSPVTYP